MHATIMPAFRRGRKALIIRIAAPFTAAILAATAFVIPSFAVGPVFVCSDTLASALTSISLPSNCVDGNGQTPTTLLPSGTRNIRLVFNGASDSTTTEYDNLDVELNGDVGAHYDWERFNIDNSATARYSLHNTIECVMGVLPGRVSGYATHSSITSVMELANAGNTTFDKAFTYSATGRYTTTTGDAEYGGCDWYPIAPAAVTNILLYPHTSGIHFAIGTTVSVYAE